MAGFAARIMDRRVRRRNPSGGTGADILTLC